MVNKLTVIIFLLSMNIFLPIFFMYLNFSEFKELDIEVIENIQSEDFNLLSLSGFSTFGNFLIQLGKFSIGNAFGSVSPIILALFTFFLIIEVVISVFFLRGGGS